MPLDPGSNSITEFHAKLQSLRRILALCGADLSELSGLSTYLGPGATLALTSSRCFETDPDIVWLFYGDKIEEKGHSAQGLESRAGHPASQIRNLHGSLFDLRCVDAAGCGSAERENFDDPLYLGQEVVRVPLKDITAWIDSEPVDLILVIGTTAMVWPAAGFVIQARNQDTALGMTRDLKHGDFAFIGDVAELLPRCWSRSSRKSKEFDGDVDEKEFELAVLIIM
ncbi:Sir2 family protein [Biscogniauxia mediterranea]|nr:Sir2 family protein [Biscogniauxia mediterranea]